MHPCLERRPRVGKHLEQCLGALQALWKYTDITRKDRLRLLAKSIRLYLCFLAFMDRERPREQCRRGMIAAVVTAVYDYETDWVPISDPGQSRTFAFLARYVENAYARQIARELFATDLARQLSADGLERGSVSLTFYHAVIGSRWLGAYCETEINEFGRRLQMVDDLLDYEQDRRLGHTNCFVTDNRDRFLAEVETFVRDDFFRALCERSVVYRVLALKCGRLMNDVRGAAPATRWELFRAGRPKNAVFAAALALATARLAHVHAPLATLIAVAYAILSISIMMANDIVDRNHDAKRGKTFARDHVWELVQFWIRWDLATLAVIAAVGVFDAFVALFLGLVWLVGIGYSFVQRWYVVQNVIVAFCVASPALATMLSTRGLNGRSVLVFGAVFGTIWMREIVGDIDHVLADRGYKETLPTRLGHLLTMFYLLGLIYLPIGFLVFYPSVVVRSVAFLFGAVAFANAMMFMRPDRQPWAIRSLNLVLAALVITLFIAP